MDGHKYAYRMLWEKEHGPLNGSILHHRCEKKWCINLEHMEAITQAAHIKEHGLPGDWGQANKQQCPAGHDYDENNTYTYETKEGYTERHCRKCRLAAKRRYNSKRRKVR